MRGKGKGSRGRLLCSRCFDLFFVCGFLCFSACLVGQAAAPAAGEDSAVRTMGFAQYVALLGL